MIEARSRLKSPCGGGSMARWFSRRREESRSRGGEIALLERPAIPELAFPPDLPPGIDGALWSSWAARWQEF